VEHVHEVRTVKRRAKEGTDMNGKAAAGADRRMAVRSMLGAVALLAAGCTMPAASSPHAASSATSSPHPGFSATSFVEKAGTGTVSLPGGTERLIPLAVTGNPTLGKVTATDAAGRSVTLVDGGTAYRAVRSTFVGYGAGNLAGPVTGGLYSYYNSAAGHIQPDGTVKLMYQGYPVWLFTAPLIHEVNDGQGPAPLPGTTPRPTPTYTGCSYVAIVDAESGGLVTSGQQCTSS
jgi:hypothetical protein